MSQTTSLPDILSSFTEKWSPRLVASINDHHVKVAKIDGAFIWHAHPDSEELFYLLSGKLTMEIKDQESVLMKEGDMYVVPKGVTHRPVAENAVIMMVEKEGTVNTGDQTDSERTKEAKDGKPRDPLAKMERLDMVEIGGGSNIIIAQLFRGAIESHPLPAHIPPPKMALPESDQFVMSQRDEWIMSRVAPTTRDLGPILSCHLDEAIVLSAYLNGEITPEAAAQEITKPSVVHSRCYQLMNLFVYALRKLDQDTDMILGLLLAIQNLPSTESLYWWKLPGFGKLWQIHYNLSSHRNSKDPAFFTMTGTLEAKMYLLDLYPVDESWVHRVLNLICLEKPNLEEVIYEIHAWLDIAGTKVAERMYPEQIKSFERCVRGRRDKTYEIQVTMYEHWEHWKKRFLQISYDEEYLSAGSREMSRKCYEIMKGLVVSPPNPPEDI